MRPIRISYWHIIHNLCRTFKDGADFHILCEDAADTSNGIGNGNHILKLC